MNARVSLLRCKNAREMIRLLLEFTDEYRLLKKMSDKGRIKLVGNGRSAYYELLK